MLQATHRGRDAHATMGRIIFGGVGILPTIGGAGGSVRQALQRVRRLTRISHKHPTASAYSIASRRLLLLGDLNVCQIRLRPPRCEKPTICNALLAFATGFVRNAG